MSHFDVPSQLVTEGTNVPDSALSGEPLVIANEFTAVLIQKVILRRGERLLLKVIPDGSSLLLDAMQLEAITRLKPEDFSRLLARNLGVE